jgi:hypothetical protein
VVYDRYRNVFDRFINIAIIFYVFGQKHLKQGIIPQDALLLHISGELPINRTICWYTYNESSDTTADYFIIEVDWSELITTGLLT